MIFDIQVEITQLSPLWSLRVARWNSHMNNKKTSKEDKHRYYHKKLRLYTFESGWIAMYL